MIAKRVIRKISIGLLSAALAVCALSAAAYLAVQSPRVQARLAGAFVQTLSSKLNARISIRNVEFRFLNRLLANDVLIQDAQNDTLLFAQQVYVSLARISFRHRRIGIRTLRLHNALVRITSDTTGKTNMAALFSPDSTPKKSLGFEVAVGRVRAKNLAFQHIRKGAEAAKKGRVNFHNLNVSGITIALNDLHHSGDTLHCTIDEFSGSEQSGWRLRDLTGRVSIAPSSVIVADLYAADEYSVVEIPILRAAGGDALPAQIQGALTIQKADLRSLAFFVPNVPKTDLHLSGSAVVSGGAGTLDINDIRIKLGAATALQAQASLCGLPDAENLYFDIKVKNLHTSADELLRLDSALGFKKLAPYAQYLASAGSISGGADFAGTAADFAASAQIAAQTGSIAADAMLTAAIDGGRQLQCSIEASNVQAGRLFGNKELGLLNLNASIDGVFAPRGDWHMQVKTDIPLLEYRGYAHRGLRLNAALAPNAVQWQAAGIDPCLKFNASGKSQWGGRQQHRFRLALVRADLVRLGLNVRDSAAQVAFVLNGRLNGSGADNIEGTMGFANIQYTADHTAAKSSARIDISGKPSQRRIAIASPIADAQASTNLEWRQLPALAEMLVRNNFPAYSAERPPVEAGSFDFEIKTKQPDALCAFFAPNAGIAAGTFIKGHITPQSADLQMVSEHMRWKNITLSGVSLTAAPQASGAHHITLRAAQLLIGEAMADSLSIEARLDTGGMPLRLTYLAAAKERTADAQARFFVTPSGKKAARIQVFPSVVMFGSEEWNLRQGCIVIDADNIEVANFRIENQRQFLQMQGSVSAEQRDSLDIRIKNIDIAPFLQLTGRDARLTGTLSGHLAVQNLLKNPIFTANVTAHRLVYDDKEIGDVMLTSVQAPQNSGTTLEAVVIKHQQKKLTASALLGSDGSLSGSAYFNRAELYYLERLLSGALDDIHGTGTGSIAIGGTLKRVALDGRLAIEGCNFVIPYLNSKFTATDSAVFDFENSNLLMKDILLHDSKGSEVYFQGDFNNITTPAKFFYNMEINTANGLALNTNALQSPSYFGEAYASGSVRISGVPRRCSIEADADVNRGSTVSFAFGNKTGKWQRQTPLISFVQPKQTAAPAASSPEISADITAKLNLNILPEAIAKVTFNSNAGDAITMSGEGSVKMEFQRHKNIFLIFGNYIIKDGEYSVNVQNLLNKKFKIEAGSQITFNGPIENASSSILTHYKLRAPLSDLFADSSPRYRQPIPINCKIAIEGVLSSPSIKFTIEAPESDKETNARMQSQFSAGGNTSMQFFSLLLTGRFMPPQNAAESDVTLFDGRGLVSDVLTSLASAFFAQLFNIDLNFRLGYNPDGGGFNSASTMFSHNLGSRVVFSATLDYQANRQTIDAVSAPVMGNVDLNVLMDRDGRFRIRLFGRTNDQYAEMLSGIANNAGSGGLGIVYQEDFNNFGELWEKMFKKRNKK